MHLPFIWLFILFGSYTVHKSYKYAISYFLGFSLLLLLSGALLFQEKIGFSINGVLDYYNGNEERFIVPKSTMGILKIVLPHIFAFGLFIMVISHFLIFTKKKNNKNTLFVIYFAFLSAFLELASPFFIINGFEFFAYIKIISFFFFEALVIYISWLLFSSIIFD